MSKKPSLRVVEPVCEEVPFAGLISDVGERLAEMQKMLFKSLAASTKAGGEGAALWYMNDAMAAVAGLEISIHKAACAAGTRYQRSKKKRTK